MRVTVTLEVDIPDSEVTALKLAEGLATAADVRNLVRTRIATDANNAAWLDECYATVNLKGGK